MEQVDEDDDERENVCERFFLVNIVPDDVRESDAKDFNDTLRSSSSSSSIYNTCVQSSVGLSSDDDGSWILRTWYSSVEDDEIIKSEFRLFVCMISIELENIFDWVCNERRIIGMERMIACDGEIGEWRNDWDKMSEDVSNYDENKRIWLFFFCFHSKEFTERFFVGIVRYLIELPNDRRWMGFVDDW